MMKEKKSSLVAGLFVLGVALVGVSLYFSPLSNKSKDGPRIASVDRELGQVFVLRHDYVEKEPIERHAGLYSLDSLETSDTGEALVTFENSARLRVLSDSLVILEKNETQGDGRFLLTLKRGFVRIENPGPEMGLSISKDGEWISSAEYNNSELAKTSAIKPESVHGLAPIHEQLLDENIAQTMNQQKPAFYKCFTQLLQKDPQAKGDVSLNFTIANNGRIMESDVTSAHLNEESFKSCLLEVLRRIEFKAFTGPPVSTLFPIQFQ